MNARGSLFSTGVWERATQFVTRRRSHRRAVALWEQAKKNAVTPPTDPLWRDLQEAELQADGDRLADIGDLIAKGASIDLFRLTDNEKLVVNAYLDGSYDA